MLNFLHGDTSFLGGTCIGGKGKHSTPLTIPFLSSVKHTNLNGKVRFLLTIEYNLLTWFFTVIKKPKLVLVQWPDHSRYIEYDFKIKLRKFKRKSEIK
jgi:hypothetical protein